MIGIICTQVGQAYYVVPIQESTKTENPGGAREKLVITPGPSGVQYCSGATNLYIYKGIYHI